MQSRQFIPYQVEAAIAPASKATLHFCQQCKSPITTGSHKVLCDLCWSILESLATPYWHHLHHDWIMENDRRLSLLRVEEIEDDDYPSQQA